MTKKAKIWLAAGFGCLGLLMVLAITIFIAVFFYSKELIELFDF